MMFRPQFVLTLLCLILAQYTFSKSIKKQSKKHSITKERSHYLLLMGNPVEDGQHHKGLGMILGSKHNEDQEKLNEADAQHSDVNSNGNLAAALQKSSNGYPSDRGYSYTEALFTGTPLLNGRPFTASDRTHNSQRHVSDHKIAQPKGNDQALKSYKGAELLDPSVDKSNDGNRHEGSAQIQKEIHTEEGVTGITVNNNPKEGQYMKTLASKGDENEETHSLNKSQEEETKPSEHGYPTPRPSLDDSLYKSQSENVGNNEEKHARESSHNQNKSEHSVEDMHQVLGTSQTLDNFTNNMGGSGQVAEENKIINQLSLKTKVKSYDEESNLLGSSTFNHGHLINRQADHALEQWQDIFNQNTSTGLTGYGTAQGLKQRQEGSNQHMITGTADSGNKESLQKDESSQKPDVDLQPNGSDQREKETNSVFQEGSHDTHGSTGSLTSQFKESRDRQTDVSNDAPGRLPAEQNREHPRVPGIKGSIDDSGKLPNGNYSIGATSKAPYEIERFINQLRPHKIIESSFDEELAHRIVTEPSYQQDSHEALTKQSNEKPSSVMSYPSQSSSTYREGSNPSDVNTQTQGGSSVQELSAGFETEPLGPVTSGRNEPEMQQDTSNRLSTSAVDHQTALVNNTGSHQEQENSESLERNSEHGTKSHYEPSNNSIRPPGYTSNQGEVHTNVSSSYRQEHNPSDFSSTNGQITEGQREKSVQAWSTSSDSTQNGPLGENQKDKTAQQGMSHPSSEGVAYARPNDEGTYTDNKSSYQEHEHMVTLQNNAEHASETNHDSSIESPAKTTNQRESNKEVLPTFYHKEGSDPTQFNTREKSLAKERGSQSFKTSSGSNQKQPDAQTETSDQMIPASGVGTRPINGGMSSQQYAKVLQSSVEQHTGKSYSSGDPLRPTLLGQRGFQVGNPEHANDLSVEDQPKGGNKDQQQTESKSDRFSEGVRNDQQKENDREDKNQTIVYYLKIAKGIPLLNRRPIHDQQGKYKENHVTGSQFPSEVTKGDSKTDSDGEMVSEWKWQRRPGPSYRPRPSPSYRPRPSFSPSPSPSPSPSSGGGGGALGGSSVDSNVPQGDSEFEQEGLSTHNKYRKTHGVQEMTLDRDLSNQAKAYAQKIANMGSLIHSSQAERGESVGENLAYSCASSGTPLTGESATKMWYDEVCKPGYNFVNGGFSGGTGHFTQVVWKDSVKLGIGQGKATQNGMQCIYVVGRYDIAGNMMGEFQDKVLKGNFNEQYCNNV